MSDLDLGMNYWLSKPFEYPDEPIKRGKILWEKDMDAMEERLKAWVRSGVDIWILIMMVFHIGPYPATAGLAVHILPRDRA